MGRSLGSAAPDALAEVSSRVPGWWVNQTNALRDVCSILGMSYPQTSNTSKTTNLHVVHGEFPSGVAIIYLQIVLSPAETGPCVILLIHHFARLSVNELPRRLTSGRYGNDKN